MTNKELKELIAEVIRNEWVKLGDGCESDQYIAAQAVIDALTPMMREIVYGLYSAKSFFSQQPNGFYTYYKTRKGYEGDAYPDVDNAIINIPECWRLKGGYA